MNDNSSIDNLAAMLAGQAAVGDPIRYANIIKATRSEKVVALRALIPEMRKTLEQYEVTAKASGDLRKNFNGDSFARRRKDATKMFSSLDQQKENLRAPNIDISHILEYHYFVIRDLYTAVVQGSELVCSANMITFDGAMNKLVNDLDKSTPELGADRVSAFVKHLGDVKEDAYKNLMMEQNINRSASANFMQGIGILAKVPDMWVKYLQEQGRNFEAYYERLRHRHTQEGMSICDYDGEPSVTLTDVALAVWENIDRVGEISMGTNKDELSAYTLHRASSMLEAAKHPEVWSWIIEPGEQLIAWAKKTRAMITEVLNFVIEIRQQLGEQTWRLSIMDLKKNEDEFIDVIESLSLDQITQRAPERAFSKTEKFAIEHRNKSVSTVANLLVSAQNIQVVSEEILKLKVEEHQFFTMENSFYVCKIGTGNMFSGEAPGGLEVIPGEKPRGNLDRIWGGGVEEFKQFIGGVDLAKKWQPLFLTTSPSQSTDKTNILLVGPQGCGKTELLRAVGAAKDSIAIFATGSDFGTAWAHESQKNPKRLFDEAIRLHKSSGRHVYILIDEIDMVLRKKTMGDGNSLNLSLEFQNLMDGLVAYPGLSLLGATNNPEMIPTPMLRRFARVMIIGELTQENRISILRHYTESFLPCDGGGFSQELYDGWATRLIGCTGDAIRKISDNIWLSFMRNFVSEYTEDAEKILEFIKTQYGEHFDISSLEAEDQIKIKEMIGEKATVSAGLVDTLIDETLNNFSIQEQIRVASETYIKARQLLQRQKAGNKGVGF